MNGAACDTSVLLPALAAWHPGHRSARSVLLEQDVAVPGHVILETFSVLTRLPAPHRFSPGDAGTLVAGIGLPVIGLPAEEHRELVDSLSVAGIRGGAAYDALVGATARHHGRRLLTRDARARSTYAALKVAYTEV